MLSSRRCFVLLVCALVTLYDVHSSLRFFFSSSSSSLFDLGRLVVIIYEVHQHPSAALVTVVQSELFVLSFAFLFRSPGAAALQLSSLSRCKRFTKMPILRKRQRRSQKLPPPHHTHTSLVRACRADISFPGTLHIPTYTSHVRGSSIVAIFSLNSLIGLFIIGAFSLFEFVRQGRAIRKIAVEYKSHTILRISSLFFFSVSKSISFLKISCSFCPFETVRYNRPVRKIVGWILIDLRVENMSYLRAIDGTIIDGTFLKEVERSIDRSRPRADVSCNPFLRWA